MRFGMALAAFAAVAACSAEDGAATEAGGQNATAEDNGADDAATVLTAEGYGPLSIGMSREEAVAAIGGHANPEGSGLPEPEYCDELQPERAPPGLFAMIEQDRVTRITLAEGSQVETDAGISVGDPASAVRQAYGERIMASPHHYSDPPAEYLDFWVGGPRTEPYVEDAEARGIRYEIGPDGNVQFIHAGSPSIQYVEGCL